VETYTREGLTFDVTDIGPTDGRVVVLLHGFPEDRHCWDRIGPALAAAGYRVIAPDQRGYSPGARPPGRRAYTMKKLRDDVLALADVAGAARFDVVGHDWGGAVAWDLAANVPERIRSLTSLSTPHPRALQSVLLRSTQLLHSWYVLFFQLPYVPEAVMRRTGRDRASRALVKGGLDADTAGRYAERIAGPGSITAPINWYRGLPLGGRQPTPEVKVPTLYVWSDRDIYLTRAAAEATSRYVTGRYRFEVLTGTSHWIPTAAADAVTPMILSHLADSE
jgi:pimeloyl-ACP methyl ester carboxylesterase